GAVERAGEAPGHARRRPAVLVEQDQPVAAGRARRRRRLVIGLTEAAVAAVAEQRHRARGPVVRNRRVAIKKDALDIAGQRGEERLHGRPLGPVEDDGRGDSVAHGGRRRRAAKCRGIRGRLARAASARLYTAGKPCPSIASYTRRAVACLEPAFPRPPPMRRPVPPRPGRSCCSWSPRTGCSAAAGCRWRGRPAPPGSTSSSPPGSAPMASASAPRALPCAR